MDSLILTLHVIVCILLIILVLLQSGKEGMGVIFGGGSASLFGSTGAGGILVKLTTFVAIVFLCTSLGYNIATSTGGDSTSRLIINENAAEPSDPAAPVTPAAPVSPDGQPGQ